MAHPIDASDLTRDPLPIGPTADEWIAMTKKAREAFLERVNDALSDPRDLMTEGRPHKKAKARIADLLDRHFRAMGRVVYVAEEMSVVYPGEPVFSPDVLAVLDVQQPEDDARMSWVVLDEKKGIDLAFEVLHHGDRKKDLVTNVTRYAKLGIPEYFVYDRGEQRIYGYRLTTGSLRYDRIVPQGGRFASRVLGLDLAIQGGKLRFFQGMAELFDTDNLIERLNGMVESLEAKADAAEVRADQATAKANQTTAKANQTTAKANQATAKANQATAKANQAAASFLRKGILAALTARGVSCSEDVRTRIATCEDLSLLEKWFMLALTVPSADALT
jgi:Uma2 family endonuclease